MKGLLGFRVGIIRRSKLGAFDSIVTFEQLKQLTVCQGSHWPDSDILEASGIRILRNPVYENMFKQVSFGRCDFFPRGIHEADSEMSIRQIAYPDLMLFKDLIIYYPFPMYFFVAPHNLQLKEQLELGLKRMIESGEFDRFLREHRTTKHLFPLSSWIDARTFVLDNPFLPPDTLVSDERFWVQPKRNHPVTD